MSPAVHLVDDDEAVRRAVSDLLEADGLIVRSFASAEELLRDWSSDWTGCIVLDLRLPGLDGLQAQRALHAKGVRLPIIFLTGHGDVQQSVRAMKAGAFDFLQKPVSADVLVPRVLAAIGADGIRAAGELERARAAERLQRLTAREAQVLAHLLDGKANKEVASALGISPRTAEVHRRNILQKTGVSGLLELGVMTRRVSDQN
jgi:two-component system response regulator DctR